MSGWPLGCVGTSLGGTLGSTLGVIWGHLGSTLGAPWEWAATLHFLGPKGTPGGRRAYTRELEDYVTPCGRLAAGARGTGGGSRPTHGLGGGFFGVMC